MNHFIQQRAAKKAELDRLRPLSPDGLSNLEHYYDFGLTYTSRPTPSRGQR